MTEDLKYWQKKLERHFSSLHQARKDKGLPVFALEHGLNEGERRTISGLLRSSLQNYEAPGHSWLLWVIYAAEQGYDYDGDEYWRTYQARTPLWTERADREALRRWYQKFHTTYGGIKPTGSWASWFSIIAWPITHALLPRDLQYQLARALYQLRFPLASRIDELPSAIGHYIATASIESSSRFQNFLQQEELVGRIALALLGGHTGGEQQFIYPPTLERIVEDMQRARDARAWLRDARQAVEKIRIKGALRHPPLRREHSAGDQRAKHEAQAASSIRPSLTLRRTSKTEWTVVLDLPSLQPLADLNPELRLFLRRTRCTVAGSPGMLPAGWLLSGSQHRVVVHWPPSSAPVVRFEERNDLLEHLLQSDGRITAGPSWLFKVGSDGLAREVVGRVVRPGERYIVVSTSQVTESSLLRRVNLKCSGAAAWEFDLPPQLSPEHLAWLRELSLSLAQTVRIWPAGLAARRWDGEGFAEWLEGETPCIALHADHPVSHFELQLDDGQPIRVAQPLAGQPLFVALPGLARGRHLLAVRAQRVDVTDRGDQAPAEGFLSIIVRLPRPWAAGTTSHSGLVVSTNPAEPSLDQLWKGDIELQILGPSGKRVRVFLELNNSSGETLSTEQITDLLLPVAPGSCARAMSEFLRKEPSPWSYLSASGGHLLVDGEEMGTHRVPLHRDVSPLRWVWPATQRATVLRLVNDCDSAEPLSASFYPFETPIEGKSLAPALVTEAWTPEGTGGLCVASCGGHRQTLVVSMPQVRGGLAGLLIEPTIHRLPPGEAALAALLDLISAWSGARVVGPLASDRRTRVVNRLREYVLRHLYGAEWVQAEASYERSQRTEPNLRRLAEQIGGNPAFGFVLARDLGRYRSMDPSLLLSSLAALAGRYGVASYDACKAAIELCGGLERGAVWTRPVLERLLADVRSCPTILRGVRFVAVAKPIPSSEQSRGTAHVRR
jgi:hypothetical protein